MWGQNGPNQGDLKARWVKPSRLCAISRMVGGWLEDGTKNWSWFDVLKQSPRVHDTHCGLAQQLCKDNDVQFPACFKWSSQCTSTPVFLWMQTIQRDEKEKIELAGKNSDRSVIYILWKLFMLRFLLQLWPSTRMFGIDETNKLSGGPSQLEIVDSGRCLKSSARSCKQSKKTVRWTKLRTVALSGRQKSSDLQKQLVSCNQSPLNIQNRPAIDPKQLQVYCSPRQKQQARCVHPMFLAENVWRKKNNSIASGGLPWCHRCAWDFWSLSMQAAERWKNTYLPESADNGSVCAKVRSLQLCSTP